MLDYLCLGWVRDVPHSIDGLPRNMPEAVVMQECFADQPTERVSTRLRTFYGAMRVISLAIDPDQDNGRRHAITIEANQSLWDIQRVALKFTGLPAGVISKPLLNLDDFNKASRMIAGRIEAEKDMDALYIDSLKDRRECRSSYLQAIEANDPSIIDQKHLEWVRLHAVDPLVRDRLVSAHERKDRKKEYHILTEIARGELSNYLH